LALGAALALALTAFAFGLAAGARGVTGFAALGDALRAAVAGRRARVVRPVVVVFFFMLLGFFVAMRSGVPVVVVLEVNAPCVIRHTAVCDTPHGG
jgi:hypothetical protein